MIKSSARRGQKWPIKCDTEEAKGDEEGGRSSGAKDLSASDQEMQLQAEQSGKQGPASANKARNMSTRYQWLRSAGQLHNSCLSLGMKIASGMSPAEPTGLAPF